MTDHPAGSPLGRRVRYGMVGGGPGAFIGEVHRKAAALDGEIELVAGAFSSDADRSRQMGTLLGLDPRRVYPTYEEMADVEASLDESERIDFVSIVTPNYLHYSIAKTFLERGMCVVCDKPLTTTLDDAEALCHLVQRHDAVFAVTYNYTGYPMVKEAREMVRTGRLGDIRKVVVEYPQGWLATLLEADGHKQAEWRTDPTRAGISSVLGDIGSHAEHLARYITGLNVEALCADVSTLVHGRVLDDDANVLLHYEGGARGVLHASQIAIGEENNLRIRVYGSKASLEWAQEDPNSLTVRYPDRPKEVYTRGNEYLTAVAQHNARLPAGHPEAFIEAFANVYVNASRTIAAKRAGTDPGVYDTDFPTVQDGTIGVHFVHAAVESGKKRGWIDATYAPPS